MATRLYPIGIQTFEKIIEGGFVYVDKTEYVHQLANTSGSSFFSAVRAGLASHCFCPQ